MRGFAPFAWRAPDNHDLHRGAAANQHVLPPVPVRLFLRGAALCGGFRALSAAAFVFHVFAERFIFIREPAVFRCAACCELLGFRRGQCALDLLLQGRKAVSFRCPLLKPLWPCGELVRSFD